MSRRRRRATLDEIRARGRSYAEIMGPEEADRRARHFELLAGRYHEIEIVYRAHRRSYEPGGQFEIIATRGAKWSATYEERKAARNAAECEAEAQGLREGAKA